MTGGLTGRSVHYMDLADFLAIAQGVTGTSAHELSYNTRTVSGAESALAAPRGGYGDHEAYPSITDKAAILCSRICRDHPLMDGNKRTAFLCMLRFLGINGYELSIGETLPAYDGVVHVIERVAAGEMSEPDFTRWVSHHTVAIEIGL